MTWTAGGLFSGIGGICAGFQKAGFKNEWAVDNNENVKCVYELNYYDTRFLCLDIKDLARQSAEVSGLTKPDVVHAGFPCQSFSQAGRRNGFEDPRGQLFFELMKVIRGFGENRPKVLLFENSPYFRIGEDGAWFETAKREIQKSGYWFKEQNAFVLDPKEHFGLPQHRPRLFMVALSKEHFRSGRLNLVKPIPEQQASLSDFIEFDGEVEDEYYLESENKYFELISNEKINKKETIYQLRKTIVRVKDHCPTLTANMGAGGHNVPFVFDKKGLRKLTEIECLKLQGFEELKFPENLAKLHKYTQIGNAVHLDVSYFLAKLIHRLLESKL